MTHFGGELNKSLDKIGSPNYSHLSNSYPDTPVYIVERVQRVHVFVINNKWLYSIFGYPNDDIQVWGEFIRYETQTHSYRVPPSRSDVFVSRGCFNRL